MAIAMDEKQASSSQAKILKKKTLLTVEDLKYARKLAENEAPTRKRTLNLLTNYLATRSKNCQWEEENLQILWKGLFYSMWMSDKPLIQEECAENISKLIHSFQNFNEKMMFFKAGLTILQNEWIGLGQHRYDKFLMFVRRILRQAFVVLNEVNFKKKFNKEFTDVLEATLLNVDKNPPIGLFMHFTEIYLEELAKVSNGNTVLKTRLIDLIKPFIAKLAYSKESREVTWINKFIFSYLIKQHDLGLEYREKFTVWKSMGFPGTINQVEKVTVKDSLEQNSDKSSDDGDNSEEEAFNGSKVMDPRAGRVDVVIPPILFQEKEIAEALTSFSSDKRTTTTSRNVLQFLSQKFEKLAQGTYPLGMKSLEAKKRKNAKNVDTNVTKAAKRLIKFEQNLLGKDKRQMKRKNSESEEGVPEKIRKIESVESKKLNKREKRRLKQLLKRQRHLNNEEIDSNNVENDKNELEDSSKQQINATSETKVKKLIKQSTKKSPTQNKNNKEKPNNKARKQAEKEDLRKKLLQKKLVQPVRPSEVPDSLDDDISIECLFRRNSGVWFVTEEQATLPKVQSSDILENLKLQPTLAGADESTPNENNLSQNKSGTPSGKSSNHKKQTMATLIDLTTQKKTTFESNKVNLALNDPRREQQTINSIYKDLIYDSLFKSTNLRGKSKTSLKVLSPKTPLQKTNQKNLKKAVSTPSGIKTKKVRINTSLNVSQEIHEHISQVFSSPMIPYDRNRRPTKPVLKTPIKASPINPFYKLGF